MKKSITQEFDYGCGIACYAFALDLDCRQAVAKLGAEQAISTRFYVKDLTLALNKGGASYISKHVKPRIGKRIYEEGTIVLIRRSKNYPTGHYLIRHNGAWMDPWINLQQDKNILNATSGFRKRLPGAPMYAILKSSKLVHEGLP